MFKRRLLICILFIAIISLTIRGSIEAGGNSAYLGDWEQELKSNQLLLEEDTDNLKTKFYLGVAYANTGQIKEGQEMFDFFKDLSSQEWSELALDAYLTLNGGNFGELKSLNHLAFLYYSDQRYERSINYFQRAIELDPKNANLYNYQALVYGELEEYEQALELLRNVEDRNEYTNLLLAVAYYKTGRRFRALYYYSRVGDEAKALID